MNMKALLTVLVAHGTYDLIFDVLLMYNVVAKLTFLALALPTSRSCTCFDRLAYLNRPFASLTSLRLS